VSPAHVLAVVAILLGALAVRSTEIYTDRYQSLPVLDWLESRPPLADSAEVPGALDLARGLSRAMPQLIIGDDARTQMPVFGPPSSVQRIVGGVRDAARITLDSPVDSNARPVPVSARLDVIVFNRTLRADAWEQLMDAAMDIRDPDNGFSQVRIAGPDDPDTIWVAAPVQRQGGIATVVGRRGPVAFELQVSFAHPPDAETAEMVDLNARAELVARQAATDWTAWLTSQLA
jgi:hypothetical protein